MEKKVLIGLLIVFIISFSGWYFFLESAQQADLTEINEKLNVVTAKLTSARHAKSNLLTMQKKYVADQQKLVEERTRFVNKNELYGVTTRLKKFASDYNLVLLDFSPEIDAYFASSPDDKIVKLPLDIVVNGNYLDIGKFIEDWNKLPFYMISEEINLERIEEDKNILDATITASLYTWNE